MIACRLLPWPSCYRIPSIPLRSFPCAHGLVPSCSFLSAHSLALIPFGLVLFALIPLRSFPCAHSLALISLRPFRLRSFPCAHSVWAHSLVLMSQRSFRLRSSPCAYSLVCYSGGLHDSSSRQMLISNVQALVRALNGRVREESGDSHDTYQYVIPCSKFSWCGTNWPYCVEKDSPSTSLACERLLLHGCHWMLMGGQMLLDLAGSGYYWQAVVRDGPGEVPAH
eukprot:1144219-Pelagomonas_calceolata.AAC.3